MNKEHDILNNPNTKKILEKTYGKFSKMTEFDNTSEIFQYQTDSFLCKRYLWSDKKE